MPNLDGAEICGHGRRVCAECVIITDAARRALDAVNLHVFATGWEERIRGWVALRLADGGSDGTLYASKADAIRHQHGNEQRYAYFSYRNAPNGFASLKDAQLFLDYHRMAYDQGAREVLADPDRPNSGLIMPTASEQIMLQRAILMSRN